LCEEKEEEADEAASGTRRVGRPDMELRPDPCLSLILSKESRVNAIIASGLQFAGLEDCMFAFLPKGACILHIGLVAER
jgi:hypothetical protein